VTILRLDARRLLGMVVALFLILSITACRENESGASWAGLPPEKVLAAPEFPSEKWPDEGWTFDNTVTLPFTSPDDARRRSWRLSDRSGGLEQEIFKFSSPARARQFFNRYDPRSYDEDFPLVLDASGRYQSSSADESHAYCLGGKGSEASCSLWAYWARYGQYILRLDYVAGLTPSTSDTFILQPGISLRRFLEYLHAFDRQVTDILQSPKVTPSSAPS
jgi:hypothetical protein